MKAMTPALTALFAECPPPFDPGRHKSVTRFVWWSWNPWYPYWSKSCWGGDTEEEAREAITKPLACKMRLYHNKLIREDGATFTEVADVPCPDTSRWHEALVELSKEQV